MAERLKAAVLKTVEGYPPSQGSTKRQDCRFGRLRSKRPEGASAMDGASQSLSVVMK
jgi:hypothetical protein